MKKSLILSILMFAILAAGVSALTFSPTSLQLPATDPGSTAIDSNTVDLVSQETSQHTYTFSDGVLSLGTRSINVNLPNDITLNAGGNQDVVVQVDVPSNQYAGTYSGNLIATSTTQSSVTASLAVSLAVNSKPNAAVTSANIEAGRGVTRTAQNAFTVSNTGNNDLNSVTLAVSDLNDANNNILSQSYISFSPSTTALNFGSSANIDIITNIPATQAVGTYTGTITVNYGGTNPVTGSLTIKVRDPTHKVEVVNNEVKVGDSSQRRNQTASKSFTVKNSGDYVETITLQAGNVGSDYNAQLDLTSFTLQPDETRTVQVSLDIPDDQDSGIKTLGQIELAYGSETASVPLKLETKTMLEITKIETEVGGEDSDNNLNDGDTLNDEAGPGDEIEFEITLENLFTNSEDIKIEDIEIRLEPHDDDIDETETDSKFDLDEGRDSTETLTINIPEKIYTGTYDLDIIVEGEDENGAVHSIFWTVSFEIEKDDDDIRLTEYRLGTSTLSCVRTTDLRVTIANFGSEDQDEAAVSIYSPDLDLNEHATDIYLDYDYKDDDNEYTKTVTISLADDFAAGTYPITITAYRNNDKEMDQKIINLKVEDCPVEETAEEEEEEETEVVITPTTGTDTGGSQGTDNSAVNAVETVETSFTNSTAFIIMLIGLDLIVLLVVLILVFKFLF